MANNSVEQKREKVEALREELRQRQAAESNLLAERRTQVQEERLDREITQLQKELAALDQKEALAKGDKPVVSAPEPPADNRTNPAPADNTKEGK